MWHSSPSARRSRLHGDTLHHTFSADSSLAHRSGHRQLADNSESMQALRVIGNLSSHGDVLFDAIDVHEDALFEIYEGKTAKLKATKLKLKAMEQAVAA